MKSFPQQPKKRKWHIIASFAQWVVVLGLLMSLAILPSSTSAQSSCPSVTTYLHVGSIHNEVIPLKQYLQSEGLLSNTQNTTYFGTQTEAALKQWQLKKGIEPTGTVGPRTRAALLNCNSSAPATPPATNTTTNNCPVITTTLARGSRHSEVRTLQTYFVSQNLLTPDSATGFFGALTERAVQNFQRANNLEAVGFTGVRTRAALRNCSGSAPVIPPSQITPPVGIPPKATSTVLNPPRAQVPPSSNTPPISVKPPLSLPPPPAPTNCTFNGNTVAHNASVTAYQSSSVAAGQTCQSQARTCSNGTLSGTYTFASCTVAAEQASLYDFGGMYGYGYDSTNGAITYNNPATGAASCPTGYSATKLLDTSGKDYPLYYCSRAHAAGTDTLYDFGGMFGYGLSTSNTNVTYVNPATGAASCPSGYTQSQAYYTATLDYPIFFCYRPHTSGFTAINDFGGMGASAASCPSGYTGTQILGTENLDNPVYFCSKAAASAASCTFNNQTIADGQSVTAYQSSTAASKSACDALKQTRTCTNGVLSGTYTNAPCSVSDARLGSYTPKFTNYITVQNGKFYDGTKAIRVSGDSEGYLMHYASKRSSDSPEDPYVVFVDEVFKKAKMMNENVLRIWADIELITNTDARNYPNVYTDQAKIDAQIAKYFDGLDFVLRKAEDNGIRIILVAYSPWPSALDAAGSYNHELLRLCKPSALGNIGLSYQMYTEPECSKKYNEILTRLMLHKNPYKNNMPYLEDKTIFAWDLFNEPINYATDSYTHNQNIIKDWIYWTANSFKTYIKPKQLLTVSLVAGDLPQYASFYPDTLARVGQSSQIFNGETTSMYEIFSIPYIDYADVHLYLSSTQPNLAGIWGSLDAVGGAKFLEEIDIVAANLGKPFIVSELGVTTMTSPQNSSTGPFVDKDAALLLHEVGTIYNWAYHKGIDGLLMWGIQFDTSNLIAKYPSVWSWYNNEFFHMWFYNSVFVTPAALADPNSVISLIKNYSYLMTR